MRQLAGRLVISELEHKENKSRVRSSPLREKILLLGKSRCRNQVSLVTCPVALYPATSESEKVSFNQLNRKTGQRIKYAKVDADTGEEVVSRHQRADVQRSWTRAAASMERLSHQRDTFRLMQDLVKAERLATSASDRFRPAFRECQCRRRKWPPLTFPRPGSPLRLDAVADETRA
jgi:Ku70/Ku80 beta-barrel domain